MHQGWSGRYIKTCPGSHLDGYRIYLSACEINKYGQYAFQIPCSIVHTGMLSCHTCKSILTYDNMIYPWSDWWSIHDLNDLIGIVKGSSERVHVLPISPPSFHQASCPHPNCSTCTPEHWGGTPLPPVPPQSQTPHWLLPKGMRGWGSCSVAAYIGCGRILVIPPPLMCVWVHT